MTCTDTWSKNMKRTDDDCIPCSKNLLINFINGQIMSQAKRSNQACSFLLDSLTLITKKQTRTSLVTIQSSILQKLLHKFNIGKATITRFTYFPQTSLCPNQCYSHLPWKKNQRACLCTLKLIIMQLINCKTWCSIITLHFPWPWTWLRNRQCLQIFSFKKDDFKAHWLFSSYV